MPQKVSNTATSSYLFASFISLIFFIFFLDPELLQNKLRSNFTSNLEICLNELVAIDTAGQRTVQVEESNRKATEPHRTSTVLCTRLDW